jgi:hypothetical protein
MKRLVAPWSWFYRYYIHYFVRVDPQMKCPSCGIRQPHQQKYDTDSKAIMNWCRTLHMPAERIYGCGAIWSTPCLVNPSAWEAVVQTQEEEGQVRVGQPEQIFVTREPKVITQEKK